MAKICVVGDTVDSPHSSVPLTPSQGFFTINGVPAHVDGDIVQTHSVDGSPHIGSKIVGTGFLTVGGKKVVLKDDVSTCGAKMLTASGFVNT